MWARAIEITLACFLAISSFIFSYPENLLWLDLVLAFFLALFSLLSFSHRLRKMHLCNLIISFFLIGLAYFAEGNPPAPPFQNYMVLGILLFMLVILPSEASKPPVPWSKFYQEE